MNAHSISVGSRAKPELVVVRSPKFCLFDETSSGTWDRHADFAVADCSIRTGVVQDNDGFDAVQVGIGLESIQGFGDRRSRIVCRDENDDVGYAAITLLIQVYI